MPSQHLPPSPSTTSDSSSSSTRSTSTSSPSSTSTSSPSSTSPAPNKVSNTNMRDDSHNPTPISTSAAANSLSALGKQLQIQIHPSTNNESSAPPYPRTPTPTPIASSMKQLNSNLFPPPSPLHIYPSPPPFPTTPSTPTHSHTNSSATSAYSPSSKTRTLNNRPTRRTVLYRTESALASIEKETLNARYKPCVQTLETMSDVYNARVIGYRQDNLKRAVLSLKFARRLMKKGFRDDARISIKLGRLLFDLCDTSILSSPSSASNSHIDFAQIRHALSLVDYGLDAYTNRPDWCDRPKDARAYVSGFVCRGLIFDTLYRCCNFNSHSCSNKGATKHLSQSQTWESGLYEPQQTLRKQLNATWSSSSTCSSGGSSSNSTQDGSASLSVHRRSRSYNIETPIIEIEHEDERDVVRVIQEEDDGSDLENNDENDRIMKGETEKLKRKTYLCECIRSLELAFSAGTDMKSSTTSQHVLQQTPSQATTPTSGSAAPYAQGSHLIAAPPLPPPFPSPSPISSSYIPPFPPSSPLPTTDESQVIQRCHVAVEGMERLRVALCLSRGYCNLNEQDESVADKQKVKNKEKAKSVINSVLDTPFSPRVCPDGFGAGASATPSGGGNNFGSNGGGPGTATKAKKKKSDVYLGIDCNEVRKVKEELKMMKEVLKSASTAPLTRCVIC